MPRRWKGIVAILSLTMSPVAHGERPRAQSPAATASQSATTQPAEDAALTAFRDAVDRYMGLRTKIALELPPMKVTSRAAEITAASDALSRAVQRGRPNAQPGTFFTPPVATVIRRRLEQALRTGPDRAAVLALIAEEQTTLARPRVHLRYPAGNILATTPAALLQVLPALPPQLEYRFIGRTLIVRDIEAAMILDYLSSALPAS